MAFNSSPKRWRLIVGLLLLSVAVFLATWWGLGGLDYLHLLSEARDSYYTSRSGRWKEGTLGFASHGVSFKMTTEEVGKILGKPVFHAGLGQVEELVGGIMHTWNGSMALYIVEYGPRFHNRITGKDEALAKEWFWVYFDINGGAVLIRRELHIGAESQREWIDLKSKTLSKQMPEGVPVQGN